MSVFNKSSKHNRACVEQHRPVYRFASVASQVLLRSREKLLDGMDAPFAKDPPTSTENKTSSWILHPINVVLLNESISNKPEIVCQIKFPLHTTLASVRRHLNQHEQQNLLQGVNYVFVDGEHELTPQEEQYCALDLFVPSSKDTTTTQCVQIRRKGHGQPTKADNLCCHNGITAIRNGIMAGATKTVLMRDLTAPKVKSKSSKEDEEMEKIIADHKWQFTITPASEDEKNSRVRTSTDPWAVGETAVHRPSNTKVEVIQLKHGGTMLVLVKLKGSLNLCQLFVDADTNMKGSLDKATLRIILVRATLVPLSEIQLDQLMTQFKSHTNSKHLCWRSLINAIDSTALVPDATKQALFWKRIHQSAYGGIGTCQALRARFKGMPPNGQISPLSFEASVKELLGFEKVKRLDVWKLYTSLDRALNFEVSKSSLIVEYETKCCELPWRPVADIIRAFSSTLIETVHMKVDELDKKKKKEDKVYGCGAAPWMNDGVGSAVGVFPSAKQNKSSGESLVSKEEEAVLMLLRDGDNGLDKSRKKLTQFKREHLNEGLLAHSAIKELALQPVELNMLFDALLTVSQDSNCDTSQRHELSSATAQTVNAHSVWLFVQQQRRDTHDMSRLTALLREQIMRKWYNGEDFKVLFRQFDPSGSGVITVAQFRTAFEALGQKAGCLLHLTQDDANQVLDRFESTNGQVRYRGFLKFVAPLETQEEVVELIRDQLKGKSCGGLALRKLFRTLNQGAQDHLNMAQLLHGLHMLGVPTAHLTDSERHAVTDAVDWSGDGRITFSKFVRFVLGSAQAANDCIADLDWLGNSALSNSSHVGQVPEVLHPQTQMHQQQQQKLGDQEFPQQQPKQQQSQPGAGTGTGRRSNAQVIQYLDHNRFY